MLPEDREAVRQMKAELDALAARLDSGEACATSYRSRMSHYNVVYTAATRNVYEMTAAASATASASDYAAGYDTGELLYMDYQDVLVHYLTRQRQPQQEQQEQHQEQHDNVADDKSVVFARVLRTWQHYQILTRWCMQAFGYLSRYYIVQHDKPSLQHVAVHLFWQHVLQPHVDAVACVTHRLLLREQDEDNDDTNVHTCDEQPPQQPSSPSATRARHDGDERRRQIAMAIQLLCAVSSDATRYSYTDRFFSPLLVAVAEAYARAAQRWSATLRANAYAQRLLDAIAREKQRCTGYFASTSDVVALVECVEDTLLRAHVTYDTLLRPSDDGLVAALHARDTHAIAVYDALFARRPWGVARLADALRAAVRAEGHALAHRLATRNDAPARAGARDDDVCASTHAPPPLLHKQLCVCVRAMMALQDAYAQLVARHMRGDATLARAVRESIERVYSEGVYVCNNNSNNNSNSSRAPQLYRVRFSELLAFYLDAAVQHAARTRCIGRRAHDSDSDGDDDDDSDDTSDVRSSNSSSHTSRDDNNDGDSDDDDDATPLLQRCTSGVAAASLSARGSRRTRTSRSNSSSSDKSNNSSSSSRRTSVGACHERDEGERDATATTTTSTSSSSSLRAVLHRVLTALDYIADRDGFFATSRNLMAQRILYPRRRRFCAARERVLTQCMRQRCGADATAALEGLLHDVALTRHYDVAAAVRGVACANNNDSNSNNNDSNNENDNSDNATRAEAVSLPCAMTLLVGKKGIWPPAVTQPRAWCVTPPPCVREVLRALQRAYLAGTRDRALVWAHAYSTAEVAMTLPSRARALTLHVSGLQGAALLALDAVPRLTIAMLVQRCCSASTSNTDSSSNSSTTGDAAGNQSGSRTRDGSEDDDDDDDRVDDEVFMSLLPLVRSHILRRTSADGSPATSVWRASDVLTVADDVTMTATTTSMRDTLVLYPTLARLHLAPVAVPTSATGATTSTTRTAATSNSHDDDDDVDNGNRGSSSSSSYSIDGGGVDDAAVQRARADRQRAALDACIVKTMKTRHKLAHSALVRECQERLTTQFAVDTRQVKQRVEELIRRGFLERSAATAAATVTPMYCYRA